MAGEIDDIDDLEKVLPGKVSEVRSKAPPLPLQSLCCACRKSEAHQVDASSSSNECNDHGGRHAQVREWFRSYKTHEGKPLNSFGLDEKAMDRWAPVAIHAPD